MQAKHSASSLPALKQLLLIGGGHSHLAVLSEFARNPIPGIRLVLVSEDALTAYSGMLPGLIAGQYSFDETHIDLYRLCEACGVTFIRDRVESIHPDSGYVSCAQRGKIHYDWVSINTGSTPNVSDIRDVGYATPVKPIQAFLGALERIERSLVQAGAKGINIGVVGAGPAGVEVILTLQARFKSRFPQADFSFHLFSSQADIVPTHAKRVREHLVKMLRESGVSIHPSFRVAEISQEGVTSADGRFEALDEVILVTGSMPQAWLSKSGLAVDASGYIRVHPTLQSISHANVFAAGDVASLEGFELEKAGVFAVRQGKPLARNLKRCILGQRLKPYRPQTQWLAIMNAGTGTAVASRGSFFAAGAWVWRWKNYIDQRFMAMYTRFTQTKEVTSVLPDYLHSASASALVKNLSMRCRGCGSKVGASVLSGSLSVLNQPYCKGIRGLQSPDDAAVIEVPEGHRLIQSLDFFSAPLDDPFIVGKMAAVHSLSDLHAMGARPHSALAMVTLPLASKQIMGETLDILLAGAMTVFREEEVCLVGGHTTEGQELSVGFSVNGFASGDNIWGKGGLQVGDVLIMTKALGSGILFAAHTQLKAKGAWLDAALERMLQSNGVASGLMADIDVHACTDITGFGLMGHLAEMIKGHDVDLNLKLDHVPFYDGVLPLSASGVRSSLYPENLTARHIIGNLDQAAKQPQFPVLFDPQTAGGLIFAVPAVLLETCLARLKAGGVEAVKVGDVVPGSGDIYWL